MTSEYHQLAKCFILVPCLAYSLALKMKVTYSSETLSFIRLQSVTEPFMMTNVRK